MGDSSFSNSNILSWVGFFVKKTGIDVEKIKIIDISKKKRNLITTLETNKRVLVFADEGYPGFFFNLWESGFGDCDIWFKTGLEPEGKVTFCKISDMLNTEITGPSVMLIVNENARSSYKRGIQNANFSPGSVHYVASEIRAIIINKLHLDDQDTICIISGESIAIEAAMLASEGQIIAVEYKKHDQTSLEDNISKFGINNISIVPDTSKQSMKGLPVPSTAFIVATDRFEEEVQNLLKINPNMKFIVYTLELNILSNILEIFKKYNLKRSEVIQIAMSKLNKKNIFEAKPSPWILTAEMEQ